MLVLKELNSFYLWNDVVVLERTDFLHFLLWEGVVVLKEMILTVSTLGGCSALERTDS